MEQDPNLSPGFLAAGSINVAATSFRINRARDFLGSRFFTGTLDEIALYDRVLTAQEVLAHAQTIGVSGDFDVDGDVDGNDFLVWQRGGSPTPNSPGDLAAWQGNFGFGATVAASAAVPEPHGLATPFCAIVAGAATMRRRTGR